jgi:hypothetical protein
MKIMEANVQNRRKFANIRFTLKLAVHLKTVILPNSR